MSPRDGTATDGVPAIEVRFPDIEQWAAGNAGLPYVWSFDSGRPGPHALVQALTHGNEVCGAIAVDWALRNALRPAQGRLTFCFANVEAYDSFDAAQPFASRCIDEDFNRLWHATVLDSTSSTADLRRARALRPLYDTVDMLLDLHSMTEPSPPLALAGRHPKGVALARGLGMPLHIVVDSGHAAGKRLRDYAFFDDPEDARSALLVECGQHWERSAPRVAKEALLRFLQHLGVIAAVELRSEPAKPQRVIDVTSAITIRSDRFQFAVPVHGLAVVPRAGTVLAYDGDEPVLTPYDECVLVMPSRAPRRGETAVRLGRWRD